MSIDLDNVTAVDDSIDLSKLDKGNDHVATEDTVPAAAGADTTVAATGEDTTVAATGEDTTPAATGEDPLPARDDKGKFIPKTRFDEVSTRARERAERIVELEAKLKEATAVPDKDKFSPSAAQTKLDALAETHTKAVLDGKSQEAIAAMREIAALNRQIAEAESGAQASQARVAAAEEMRIERALDTLEAAYPELKEGGEKFDAEIAKAVYDEAVNIQSGRQIAFSRALLQAAPKVYLARENEALRAEIEALKTKKPLEDKTKKTPVAKNTAAAAATAPATAATGADSDKGGDRAAKPDVTKLTDDEYAALPESTKARLRGDEHVPS